MWPWPGWKHWCTANSAKRHNQSAHCDRPPKRWPFLRPYAGGMLCAVLYPLLCLSTAPPGLPRWVPARGCPPPAQTPSPTRRAQSRPRRAYPLDGAFPPTLPTLCCARRVAASRSVLEAFRMTGFDGFCQCFDQFSDLQALGASKYRFENSNAHSVSGEFRHFLYLLRIFFERVNSG